MLLRGIGVITMIDKSDMRLLVTGAAGFIGNAIVRHALEQGILVVGYDNLSTGDESNLDKLPKNGKFIFERGDVCDFEHLMDVMGKHNITHVSHQAAFGSVPRSIEKPMEWDRNNAYGTLSVFYASHLSGIQRVVWASSSAVYGDGPEIVKHEDIRAAPTSPYAVSKLSGEYYGRVFSSSYGLSVIALRYFNVFGPRQALDGLYSAVIPAFIRNAIAGQPLRIYGDGSATRDFIHVHDVARANLVALAAHTAHGEFNIASGQYVSIRDLAQMVINQTQSSSSIMVSEVRPGDIAHSRAEISAAQKALGFCPKITFSDGLMATINWYRENSSPQ